MLALAAPSVAVIVIDLPNWPTRHGDDCGRV
jgi:hypothetical protein